MCLDADARYGASLPRIVQERPPVHPPDRDGGTSEAPDHQSLPWDQQQGTVLPSSTTTNTIPMKTLRTRSLTLAIASIILTGTPALAGGPRKVTVDAVNLGKLPEADQQRVLFIAERLGTIADTDLQALSREERRSLRQEARSLKSEAEAYNRAGGGTVIYISTAGLIIIILLLIILF